MSVSSVNFQKRQVPKVTIGCQLDLSATAAVAGVISGGRLVVCALGTLAFLSELRRELEISPNPITTAPTYLLLLLLLLPLLAPTHWINGPWFIGHIFMLDHTSLDPDKRW